MARSLHRHPAKLAKARRAFDRCRKIGESISGPKKFFFAEEMQQKISPADNLSKLRFVELEKNRPLCVRILLL